MRDGNVLTTAQDPTPIRWDAIDIVEAAVQASFFSDEERARAVRTNPELLDAAEMPARELMYTATLRAMAQLRMLHRQQAKGEQGYNPRQWNSSWSYDDSRYPQLLKQFDPTLQTVGRQLIMLNNIEGTHGTSQVSGRALKPFQTPIHNNIVRNFFQARPKPKWKTDGAHDNLTPVAVGVVKAPTGAGKTALMGVVVSDLGIGRAASDRHPRPLRALLIEPSVDLIAQITGRTGDKTFARFSNGVRTTAYYQDEKDLSGDVVAANKESLKNAIRLGHVKRGDFDITLFDEVHHALEPQMLEILNDLGTTVLGFSATLAYNQQRDVKKLFTTVSEDHLIDYVRDGYLNGAQIFTFIENDPQMRILIAAESIKTMVANGRQVVAFCEPGGHSLQARQLAALLRKQSVNAKAVGNFQSSRLNDRVKQDFDRKRIQVITTVGKLREGWNAPVTGVVSVGGLSSILKAEQLVGRGTRPNEECPVTTYVEIGDEDAQLLLWEVFGLDTIEQGQVIGGYKIEPSDYSQGTSGMIRPMELDDLPVSLQERAAAINHKPVRQVTVATREIESLELPPEGTIPLHVICEAIGISEARAKYRLGKAQFAYYGTWETDPETGQRYLIRNYQEEAYDYLLAHPDPPIAEEGEMTHFALSRKLNVAFATIEKMAEQLGIQPVKRLTPGNRNLKHFTPKQIAQLAEELALIEWAEFTDVTFRDLQAEFGFKSRKAILTLMQKVGISYDDLQIKWYYQTGNSSRGKNVAAHFSEAQADAMREYYYSRQNIRDRAVSVDDLAAKIHVSNSSILNQLTPGERSLLILVNAKVGPPLNYIPNELASVIERRIAGDPLPPYVVPSSVIMKLLNIDDSSKIRFALKSWLREPALKLHLRNFTGTHKQKHTQTCYPWAAVEILERIYGRRSSVGRIRYSNLPSSADDTDRQKIEYAQELQQKYFGGLLASYPHADAPSTEEEKDSSTEVSQAIVASVVSPDAPQILDSKDISALTGADEETIEHVITAAEESNTGQPAASTTVDSPQERQLTGTRLQDVLIGLQGVSPAEMSQLFNVPEQTIIEWLSPDHIPSKGRYDVDAFKAAQKEFQPPKSGEVDAATVAKGVDMTMDEVISFVRNNGGTITHHYNTHGERLQYLPPYSVKLITMQRAPVVATPDANWCNRDEIALLSRKPASVFDDWLKDTTVAGKQIRWCRTRDGSKILPHFDPNLIGPYIRKQRLLAS